jgi:ribosomal protein S4
MWNWEKIHSTSELKYLFINRISIDNSEELEKIWRKIYDEYLIEFGLSQDYKDILEQKKKIANLKADYIIKEDRIMLNYINIEKAALKSMYGDKSKETTFRDSLVKLERIQGIKINTKEITVADYYNYLRSIKKNG